MADQQDDHLTSINVELKRNLSNMIKKKQIEKTTPAFNPFEKSKTLVELKAEELGHDIEQYCEWVARFQQKKQAFFHQIHEIIQKVVQDYFGKDCRVTWSGSFSIGMHMPWSDANFEIKNGKYHVENDKIESFQARCDSMKALFTHSYLERKDYICILKLRMTSKYNHQSVEIIFKRQMPKGTPIKEEVMADFLRCYPVSKPLYLVLRSLLHRHKLDDPSSGGMVSFALFLMIIGFVQHLDNIKSMSEDPTNSRSLEGSPHSAFFTWDGGHENHRNAECINSLREIPNGNSRRSLPVSRLEADEFGRLRVASESRISVGKSEHLLNEDRSTCKSHSSCSSKQIGEALIYFLQMFGFLFDYQKMFVMPSYTVGDRRSPFNIKSDSFMNSLMIIHPRSNNLILTKNFKRTQELRHLLQMSYVALFSECGCSWQKDARVKKRNQGSGISIEYIPDPSERVADKGGLAGRENKSLLGYLLNLS